MQCVRWLTNVEYVRNRSFFTSTHTRPNDGQDMYTGFPHTCGGSRFVGTGAIYHRVQQAIWLTRMWYRSSPMYCTLSTCFSSGSYGGYVLTVGLPTSPEQVSLRRDITAMQEESQYWSENASYELVIEQSRHVGAAVKDSFARLAQAIRVYMLIRTVYDASQLRRIT